MPDPNQNICIFAGSRAGFRPAYADAARALVQAIAAAGHGVVYGGGNVGLMNVAAEEGLRLGIPVIGVIPRSLVEREVVRRDLSELHIVDDMLSRKALMAERAAGYVALPGGIGTLDEILEMVTWTQLDFQTKRCGLLDVDGFYRPFVAVLEHTVSEGFLDGLSSLALDVDARPEVLVGQVLQNGVTIER